MSRNMGTRTQTADAIGSRRSESAGLVVRKICPACKKVKKAGSSHPKCSPELQKMSQRGEL